MAILERFVTVVRSNLNHLIGKAEDPEKMLNQMLLDMQEQLITAKRQVAVAIADEKRLSQHFDKERTQMAEWEKKAMLAINAGRDDLASQALERKAEHEKLAQGFGQQWQMQKDAVEKLKIALEQLSKKIEDAKRRKNLLVARAKRAEAQKTITDTMSGMSRTSALETINRMEEKIDQMEAEATAATEMASEAVNDKLAAEFDKLESNGSSDALMALKAKMGKGALPGAHTSQLQLSRGKEEIIAEIEEDIKTDKSGKF